MSLDTSPFAFPSGDEMHPGLTLREYFAAHAPPVPEWWPDKPEEDRTTLPIPEEWHTNKVPWGESGGMAQEVSWVYLWRGWNDFIEESDIPLKPLAEFKKHLAACDALRERQKSEFIDAMMKYEISWRWFYAEAMCKTRSA